ncbi:MAG TPA: tetratricopeptide repeat protein [Gemmatimonadaceae bacterium]
MSADELLWRRWNEVDALLAGALELAEADRESYIARETINDPELGALVTRLLERLSTDRGRLTAPSGEVVRAAFGDAGAGEVDLAPGTVVGPYVIVGRWAQGGMATVYEAERADGAYRQRVALKMLRRGLDTMDLVQRFLRERQILSSLSHPNIARLLDGGAAPDGRPYLVMEFVEGDPITTHADAKRLDVNARLDLVQQVAGAVHAAHRQLVVHRDIKPSNILVNADGSVKLLDFGIAKLLEGDTEHTQVGVRALTPSYASPEQIRGESITTAADVYQLGLLLRELLTGIRPQHDDAGAEALPVRASRLATLEWRGAPPAVERATARDTTPERLARQVSGDLDVIIAKALRPEPEQRYASADELASDIRRHLRGLPIAAHPESRTYRLRKLVRRNPWGAAAPIVAGVALVGYALTTTVQTRRVATERDRAEQEASKAAEVTEFLVQLFQGANPNEEGSGQVTVRDLLDRGLGEIETEPNGDPAVRAAMLSAIGKSYYQLGQYQQARRVMEQAVAERRAAHGGMHRDVASDLSQLAQLVARTDRPAALLIFADALDVAEQTAGPTAPLVGRILTLYALTLSRANQEDARVQAMLDRAVAILRAAPGDNRAELATALSAAAYGKALDIALPRMREALMLRRAVYGDRHAGTAMSLSDLALATERVDPIEADSLMQEALTIMEAVHGTRHASTLGIMNNLAGLRRDRGAYREAAPLYRQVLALRRELYPDESGGQAYALYGLGLSLAESGSPREAETHLRDAYRILRISESPGSILLTLTQAAVGYSLARQRRFTEAEPLLAGAATRIRDVPLNPVDRISLLERVVWMYRAWGRDAQAAGYEEQLDHARATRGDAGAS